MVYYESVVDRSFRIVLPTHSFPASFKIPFIVASWRHGMLDSKIIKGTHPALISEETFLRINDLHR